MIFGLSRRSSVVRALALCLAWGAVLAATPVALHAKPLDKEACDGLQAEKQSLVSLGVDKEMAKGADWAKTNLPPARLDLVKRFLTVDEQLKFRCGQMLAALPNKAQAVPASAKALGVAVKPPRGQTAAAAIVPGVKSDLAKPATTPAAPRGKVSAAASAAAEEASSAATEVQGGLTVRAKSSPAQKAPAPKVVPAAPQ